MRDGSDVLLPVACMPTPMGRAVDAMWREAEGRQALGRTRPVHREHPAVVLWATSCIPDGLTWDGLMTMHEALDGHAAVWATVARTRGIVEPGISGCPEAAAFAAARGTDTGWRPVAWTEAGGRRRQGVAAGYVADVRGTLRALGVPEADLAGLVVGEAGVPFRPWPVAPLDRVEAGFLTLEQSLAFAEAWQAHRAANPDAPADLCALSAFEDTWRAARPAAGPQAPEVAPPPAASDAAPAAYEWGDDDLAAALTGDVWLGTWGVSPPRATPPPC